MIPRILIGACAAIVLFLGGVHLAYTFFTHNFSPTEGQLETAMKQAAPRISSDMTMWKAWISFLAALGLLMLVGYVVLARVDWFNAPLIGVSLATLFYVTGLVGTFARQ